MAKAESKVAEKVVEQTETANPEVNAGDEAIVESISLVDLNSLAQIIDLASTRGAFKANEMAGVGFLYNKLQAFLAKVAPEQTPEGATAGAPTTLAPATAGGK